MQRSSFIPNRTWLIYRSRGPGCPNHLVTRHSPILLAILLAKYRRIFTREFAGKMEQNIGMFAGNWEILHLYNACDSFSYIFANT